MDHLGCLVTVIVAPDRQEPFICQPNDDLPVAEGAFGSLEYLTNVGPRMRGEVIYEHLPDNSLVRCAQTRHDSVGVSC